MRVLCVIGTRPEAIKMAPLVLELRKHPDTFECLVCSTGQHRQMLDQVMQFFEIAPDFDLNLMKPNQTLEGLTADALVGLKKVIADAKPDIVFVQGDTTSAFAGALAAYYCQVPVAHLEAGLRSGNIYSPFPEEGNRKMVGHLATYHFAPTAKAVENLAREGIINNVWQVGNTVIDALLLGLEKTRRDEETYRERFSALDFSKRIVLITGHRRESFGEPFEQMCLALRDIATQFADVALVYPVHLNPNVREPVRRVLSGLSNVHLIEPLPYPELIWLMNKSCLVITDSGGIQEEAASLFKHVLVTRDVTERTEGVDTGIAQLVGTDRKRILVATTLLLGQPQSCRSAAYRSNPYGSGDSAAAIAQVLSGIPG